jgi:uncharacterized protein YkwD
MERHCHSTTMKKLLLPVLLVGGVLGVTCYAQTQSASDLVALTQYRVALDQIAAGKPDNARSLLEAGMQRGETGPETAALLAYLQERAGDSEQASQTLQGVATPTGFTSTFLSHLGAGPTAVEVATSRQRSSNPAQLESTDARVTRLEKLMWQIVNEERRSKNLPALAWNDDMASVSRAHSAEMRDKKYFAHESPTPRLKDPLDRYVVGIGHSPRLVAENVYRAWGSRSFLNDNDIRDAHASLMKSPGHRANILINGATKMGIGITANASGDIWITQMFARERD